MQSELKTFDQVRQTAIDLALKFGPKVLVALLFLIAGFIVGRWIGGITEKGLRKLHLEPPARQLLVRIVKLVILALFFILAVENLGIELLPLIAGLGVAGAGVALAMQGVLGNLVAGLTVIFTKPFSVGEYISIAGEEGRVESISLFNTELGHPDLSRVVIPNRKVVGEILHNYGRMRQIEVIVSVPLDADLNRVLATLNELLHNTSFILKDPAPLIVIDDLGASAIDVAVKPWVAVEDYARASSEMKKMIVETFRARKIDYPIPVQQVRLLGSAAS